MQERAFEGEQVQEQEQEQEQVRPGVLLVGYTHIGGLIAPGDKPRDVR